MTWTDAHTQALRAALLVLGAISVIAGLLFYGRRDRELNGLALALIVVGVFLIVADPAARLFGLW
jgi:membrane-bound ClpP family serine protease